MKAKISVKNNFYECGRVWTSLNYQYDPFHLLSNQHQDLTPWSKYNWKLYLDSLTIVVVVAMNK